jgi:hypothetical protein
LLETTALRNKLLGRPVALREQLLENIWAHDPMRDTPRAELAQLLGLPTVAPAVVVAKAPAATRRLVAALAGQPFEIGGKPVSPRLVEARQVDGRAETYFTVALPTQSVRIDLVEAIDVPGTLSVAVQTVRRPGHGRDEKATLFAAMLYARLFSLGNGVPFGSGDFPALDLHLGTSRWRWELGRGAGDLDALLGKLRPFLSLVLEANLDRTRAPETVRALRSLVPDLPAALEQSHKFFNHVPWLHEALLDVVPDAWRLYEAIFSHDAWEYAHQVSPGIPEQSQAAIDRLQKRAASEVYARLRQPHSPLREALLAATDATRRIFFRAIVEHHPDKPDRDAVRRLLQVPPDGCVAA